MITRLTIAFLALGVWEPSQGADQTLTGKLSDSICAAVHKSTLEHDGQKLPDRDCTIACVKKGGKYVFVSQGKVYHIANQDFEGLEEHAGQTVTLSGDLLGGNLKVSRIAAASGPRRTAPTP